MTTCRYNPDTNTRTLPNGDTCPDTHCRNCGRTHTHQARACAECLATVRDNLHTIGHLCNALPDEVTHRGINGEAMVLLGPTINPEARGHVEASIAAGRLPNDWLDHADPTDNLHPHLVIGCWDMLVRDALNHHEDPDTPWTLTSSIDYLDRQLTYLAGYEHLEFPDLAANLADCRTHLEAVLHDGEQIDRGAPCMTCTRPLQRIYAGDPLPWTYRDGSQPHAAQDCWACPRCREWRSEQDYRLNVANVHRAEASWLTDHDMALRTGIKASTIRSWGRTDGPVKRKRGAGRTLYAVADVERVAHEKGMMSA